VGCKTLLTELVLLRQSLLSKDDWVRTLKVLDIFASHFAYDMDK